MLSIFNALKDVAQQFNLQVVDDKTPISLWDSILINWAKLVAPKPLVILFDDVDSISSNALSVFLSRLRNAFPNRGVGKFPVSVLLSGVHNVKSPNPQTPFNIVADSAELSNFHNADIAKLFAQRTAENGQQITQEALDYVYEQSQGQPWLVNSLFMRATMRILEQDSTETVTLDHIKEARLQMILARETHLDALAYRLEDPRIRKVMESLMTGEPDLQLADSEGFRLTLDLGLVTIVNGTPQVANPIYREILARQMTCGPQLAIPQPEWQWQKSDGSLDMDRLLREFQKFWQRHSEVWEQKSDYTEAFPHLLLMAFLQRITNGGGHIDREYAAGRGRLDLAVEYNKQSYIIEVKLIHYYDSPNTVKEEGLEQILAYRDKIDASAPAYLVIFDRRPDAQQLPWSERIKWQEEGEVTVVGC
ncbi:hypothetical protein SAMD00024442_25_15 [Candidatus Symbiothrix dinenymphae]|nr:hypothetical protein SAMD00024442_25_15 [Candidatus Symbiothrix dinenymphae]